MSISGGVDSTTAIASTIISTLPRWGKESKAFDAIAATEFSRMIYASNALEDTGLNLSDTTRLCKLVFTDQYVPETYRDEKRWEAQRRKRQEEARWRVTKWACAFRNYIWGTTGATAARTTKDPKIRGENLNTGAGEDEDLRRKDKKARREVIQHARAWKFLLERFCIAQEELSIALILKTHTILCAGHEPDDDRREWWAWSGQFRDFDTIGAAAAAGVAQLQKKEGSAMPTPKNYKNTKDGRKPVMYIRATAVQRYIETMVEDFGIIRNLQGGDGVEGYCKLAAWVGGMMMNIWPFKEENGKMARLVMNAVLWRYCGVVAAIGEGKGEKEEYLGIVNRAGEVFHGEEFGVPAESQRGHDELCQVVRRKVEESRRRVLDALGQSRWWWWQ